MLSKFDPVFSDPRMAKRAIPITPVSQRGSIAFENGVQVAINQSRFISEKSGVYGLLGEIATTNLLTANQSSVETDLAGLDYYALQGQGTAEFTRDSTNAYHGSASAKLRNLYAGEQGSTIHSGYISISPDKPYAFSVMTRGTGSNHALAYLAWYDSSFNFISQVNGASSSITDSWTKRSVIGKSPANAAYVSARLSHSMEAGGMYWWDAAQLEQKSYLTGWHIGGATRTSESCFFPLSVISKILNLEEGTIEWELYVNDSSKVINVDQNAGWGMKGGTPEERFWFYHDKTTPDWSVQVSDGVNSIAVAIADSHTPNGWHKFAFRWKKNTGASLILNGDIILSTTFIYPVKNHYDFYLNSYGSHLNTHFRYSCFSEYCFSECFSEDVSGDSYLNTHFRNYCFSDKFRSAEDIRDRAGTNPPFKIDKYVTAYLPLQTDLNGWMFR